MGYHGCDASVAKKIVAGEDALNPSENDYDWLGHGLYFWEDSFERAHRWALDESSKQRGKVKRPAVLGAIIELRSCLDLVQVEHLDLVKNAYERMLGVFREANQPVPANTGKDLGARALDCAVFQSLHVFREEDYQAPFDTVRAFFTEGEPLYPTAGIRQLDHIQICVRNPACIAGYFLPLQ